MILKDGFIQPERLSLVTLDRPTHYPMGSRRGDPAADAAPLNTKNVINGEGQFYRILDFINRICYNAIRQKMLSRS